MRFREIVLAHEPDIAWIIALWLATHGGDPGPEVIVDETSQTLAATLSAHLAETHGLAPLTAGELEGAMARLGVKVDVPQQQHVEALETPVAHQGRTFCFHVDGVKVCTKLVRAPGIG